MIAEGAGRRIGATVPVAVAAAWAVALLAQGTGTAALLHAHDDAVPLWVAVLLPPFWITVAVFLVAWQIMLAAMMLPSSMPMIRLFTVVAARQARPYRMLAAFLGGYAVVWSAFGAGAFLADVVVHRAADGAPWLGSRPWLQSGAVLMAECRHPGPFLMRHYRRGAGGAFALGRRHGLFCLGCCWALMLLMFAAGVASLIWMALLGAVMYYEKAGRHGRAITPVVGVALVCWGLAVVAHPAWLPGALAGVAS